MRERVDVFAEDVRTKLTALTEHVAEIVRGFSASEIVSLTGYDYILNALES